MMFFLGSIPHDVLVPMEGEESEGRLLGSRIAPDLHKIATGLLVPEEKEIGDPRQGRHVLEMDAARANKEAHLVLRSILGEP